MKIDLPVVDRTEPVTLDILLDGLQAVARKVDLQNQIFARMEAVRDLHIEQARHYDVDPYNYGVHVGLAIAIQTLDGDLEGDIKDPPAKWRGLPFPSPSEPEQPGE